MSINIKKCKTLIEMYPEIQLCIRKSSSMKDALPSYEYLYSLKPKIPKELYVFYFRTLLLMNSANVPRNFILKMFEGIEPEDIMYQNELDTIKNEFADYITIYRGTTKDEMIPGLFWSKYKDVAEGIYYRGKLMKAKIHKKSILLYSAHEAADGEIIANVMSDYKIIKEE